jgi:hypothetical protein
MLAFPVSNGSSAALDPEPGLSGAGEPCGETQAGKPARAAARPAASATCASSATESFRTGTTAGVAPDSTSVTAPIGLLAAQATWNRGGSPGRDRVYRCVMSACADRKDGQDDGPANAV